MLSNLGMSQRVSLSMRDKVNPELINVLCGDVLKNRLFQFTDLVDTVYEERLIADHIPFYTNLYMNNNFDWLAQHGEDVSNFLRQNWF